MSELKPCPFCGGKAKIDRGQTFRPWCSKCGVMFRRFGSIGEAIEAWNTRPTPDVDALAREYVLKFDCFPEGSLSFQELKELLKQFAAELRKGE